MHQDRVIDTVSEGEIEKEAFNFIQLMIASLLPVLLWLESGKLEKVYLNP